MSWGATLAMVLGATFVLGATGCRPEPPLEGNAIPAQSAGAFPQRAYVWQRDWKQPVAKSLLEGRDILDGCVILGAEVEWRGGVPTVVKPLPKWEALKEFGKPVSLALRIAPYPGPYESKGEVTGALVATVRALLAEAAKAGVPVAEFQLDFDCAQKKLKRYAEWVKVIRRAVEPHPLVITALPSWLAEPTFPDLAREASRYVLQVHSISSPQGDARTQICDPVAARRWVAQAAGIGLPYEIALPTYRSYVGYSPEGKLLGVVSDSVRPNWSMGATVREYSLDAEAMAGLVREWTAQPPAFAKGLLWYRLPVETDENNWRWPTLRAVMKGRVPARSWQVRVEGLGGDEGKLTHESGSNPVDLFLVNAGEVDEAPDCKVVVRWETAARAVAEGLPGWEARREARSVVFFRAVGNTRRLPPGNECAMGWLRLEPGAPIHVEVVPVR